MANKSEPKADPKADADKRKTEIIREYETLVTIQRQDEPSVVKALCTRYSIDQAEMDEVLAEVRQDPTKPRKAGPANPAHGDQMGEAPPKGTVQSGKEPKAG